MKNTYISPAIEIELCSKEDIMQLSDTFISVDAIWGASSNNADSGNIAD